jgi:hypothetical protein
MLDARLEQLIERVSNAYGAQIDAAREPYYQKCGEPFQDEPGYEARLRNFVEWYVFDHVLAEGLTPYEGLMSGGTVTPDEKQAFLPFRDLVHSLFSVRKTLPGGLVLRELFTERDYTVAMDGTAGYESGAVVEERIVPVEGLWYPTNTHIYHAPELAKFILGNAKKLRKEKRMEAWNPFVCHVGKLQLKAQRYRHVDRVKIYQELLADSPTAGKHENRLASREI